MTTGAQPFPRTGEEPAEFGPLGFSAHEGCPLAEAHDVGRLPGAVANVVEVPAVGEALEAEPSTVVERELRSGTDEWRTNSETRISPPLARAAMRAAALTAWP
jgi:hypothetical protein